jgi:hypothetical protein
MEWYHLGCFFLFDVPVLFPPSSRHGPAGVPALATPATPQNSSRSTPPARRSEFAGQIWALRREHGTDRPDEVPF